MTACSSQTAAPPGGPLERVEAPPTELATVDGGRRGGSLRVSLQGDPASIDPRRLMDEAGELVTDAVFDSLVALDEDLEVIPAAAADWQVGDDGLTYTFELREDARFHDGERVTAEAFVRSFERIVSGDGRQRSFTAGLLSPVVGFEAARRGGAGLEGVRALDDHVLEIRLSRRHGGFLTALAHPSLAPVPEAAATDPEAFREQPVGNGPFAMDQPWEHDQFIRLRRFAGHHRPPLLDEVVFQIYPDQAGVAQQYEDFTEGGLDVAHAPPTVAGREEDGPGDLQGPGLITAPSLSLYFLGFDVSSPPFDDEALRRAVSLAIDRRAITEELLAGTRRPADGILPPALVGGDSGPCPICRHDPQGARAALAEASVDGALNRPLRLLHNTGRTHREIAEAVAEQLRTTLQLQVEVSARELEDYAGAVRDGRGDLFRSGWQPRVPSAGAVLEPLFTSDGEHNLGGYSSSVVDELARSALTHPDPETQTRLWEQLEARVLDDAAVAPLFVYEHDLVVSDQVGDFRLQPDGSMDLEEVWLEQTR